MAGTGLQEAEFGGICSQLQYTGGKVAISDDLGTFTLSMPPNGDEVIFGIKDVVEDHDAEHMDIKLQVIEPKGFILTPSQVKFCEHAVNELVQKRIDDFNESQRVKMEGRKIRLRDD